MREAAVLLRAARRVLIVSHEHPDGDAIAASLAMLHLLRAIGTQADVFNVDPIPYNFRFLPGNEGVLDELPPDVSYDVTCVLDCSSRDQVGAAFPDAGWGERILAIDHHRGRFDDVDLRVQDESAAAVGELVYWLAEELGVPLSESLATCIYCSLMADTGCFKYSSTSATALAMASELVTHGVDVWGMASRVYENNPVERIQLLAKVLGTLWLSSCGRIAAIRITRRMFRDARADDAMIDGFINHARSIRGVEVAAQLREVGNNDYHVSFRTRGNVDVSLLAKRFGGGGTRHAAGCNVRGHWREVLEDLQEALAEIVPLPLGGHDEPSRGPSADGAASSA